LGRDVTEKFYDDTHWHLDRKVPIVLIVALLTNSAIGIWWLSSLSSRVTHAETMALTTSSLNVEIVQMKEQLRGIDRTITRLENFLDRASNERLEKETMLK
jgi:hypothetical protein